MKTKASLFCMSLFTNNNFGMLLISRRAEKISLNAIKKLINHGEKWGEIHVSCLKSKWCLFVALGMHSMLDGKVIIWDLVGVLFEPNKMAMGMHIVKKATGSGFWNMLKIAMVVPSEAHMKQMVRDVLEQIESEEPRDTCFPDDEGVCVSPIHCDYLACRIPSKDLKEKINHSIEQLASEGYFKNALQKKLVIATMETIFTPHLYAFYMRPVKKGIALLKECADKKDAQGRAKNQMMILSNWDCESFPLLQQEKANQKVFQYFKQENIFISGQFRNIDGLKPCDWIFNYLIDYKNLKPSDFILIDNSPANVKAAQAHGMHAVLIDKGNYKEAQRQLQKLGAL